MKQNFEYLINERRYEELENTWLESMTSGSSSVHDFLYAAKMLGRQKEKERAGLLLGLLAQHFLETQNWNDRLKVLQEIAKHCPDGRLEDLKFHLEDALKQVYADSPSLPVIFRHFRFYGISSMDELVSSVERMEKWLSRDIGKPFYLPGHGAGRVKEINMNLGLIRIDFEKKKDVTFELDDTTLVALPAGHVLREKLDDPVKLRKRAFEEPHVVLQQLFTDLQRPMTVSEIKENLAGIIEPEEWSKWWSAAKKHPQIVVSGKGVQATYSWMDSVGEAEQAVKRRFLEGDLRLRLEIAKQYASRSPEVNEFLAQQLESDATRLYESKQFGALLELLDLFTRWPVTNSPQVPFSLADIAASVEPLALLGQTDNANIRLRLLNHYMEALPDQWTSIYSNWILQEETPRILDHIAATLNESHPEMLRSVIDSLVLRPYTAPAAFTWVAESGANEHSLLADKLSGSLLIAVFTQVEEPEFSSFRNRLKKAIEGGLLLNILNRPLEEDVAKKALDLLDRADSVEEYRVARWKNAIVMRFPQMKKKEDVLFSTQEAIDRKRTELEHLIQVELPQNRKAVGEAAAHGDLRENHEYKAARERQEYLINRVQQLQMDLAKARAIEPGKTDTSEIRPGTVVHLTQPGKQSMAVTLLGPWDSNPGQSIYSYQSPVGENLLGHKVGENVTINDQAWVIERIEPWNA